ncbi:hypothetical protein ACIBO5_12680 [Nonomuraea angiospora]|uniref:hypothetical protein n=1 Tax=Nonomuraea angiospora TaxID=46172 RepID=UPI0037B614C4
MGGGDDTDAAHLQQTADVLIDEFGQFGVGGVNFVGQVTDAAGQALHDGAAGALFGVGDRCGAQAQACVDQGLSLQAAQSSPHRLSRTDQVKSACSRSRAIFTHLK